MNIAKDRTFHCCYKASINFHGFYCDILLLFSFYYILTIIFVNLDSPFYNLPSSVSLNHPPLSEATLTHINTHSYEFPYPYSEFPSVDDPTQ
jgi:hypothetical protein